MKSYYDDNYGHYEIESEEDIEFYHRTQRQSILKKCSGCGRMVKIKPEYGYCNSCADKIEQGWDF
jgi:rRNA maturation endonuclease Nob1